MRKNDETSLSETRIPCWQFLFEVVFTIGDFTLKLWVPHSLIEFDGTTNERNSSCNHKIIKLISQFRKKKLWEVLIGAEHVLYIPLHKVII